VALDPVSVSFGAVPYGSGQTQPFAVTLNNLHGTTMTYSLAVTGGDGSVAYSVSPSTVTLGAGASATVNVIMSAVKDAALGGHQGKLTISSGNLELAHAAVYTLIK
jgi:minor extracellular serine protease Vpr